jgi:hypothetical protein
MKISNSILIVSLLITACSLENNLQEEELPISKNLNLETKSIRNTAFDEFFTIERTHILDYSEFIPSLDKAISTSNYIFSFDKYKANKLFRIEKESGNTIAIGREGEGPGEYLDMVDFDVIEEENKLIIADNSNGFIKLLYYDLEGAFTSERLFEGITADYFAVLKDGNLLFHTEGQCYDEQCFDFVITNQEGEILSNYSRTPAILSEYWIEQHKPLFRTEDGRIIGSSYSNTSIYVFESAQKVEKYEIGTEDQFIKKDFLDKLDIEDDIFEEVIESFKFYFPENPIQIGDNLIFSLEYRGNIITALYNLSTGENHLIHSFSGGIFNLNATFKIIGVEDDMVVILLNSEHLLANNTIEEIKENLKIESQNLEQPILAKAKLNIIK